VRDAHNPKAPLIATPFNQQFSRGQGCWNCMAWENDTTARNHWETKRRADLEHARRLSQFLPQGEDDPQVKQLRRMVDAVDHNVAAGVFGVCRKGKAGADLVHFQFLCEHWVGRTGASLATEGKTDLLPEELRAAAEGDLKASK